MADRCVRHGEAAGLVCIALSVLLLRGVLAGEAGVPGGNNARAKEIIWAAFQAAEALPPLEITYPQDGTLFPPDIAAPTFRWEGQEGKADAWLATVAFADGGARLSVLATETHWRPSPQQWAAIKRRSGQTEARVSVVGVRRGAPGTVLSAGRVSIRTSKDAVGAPLFYREVNLPFIDAVKDPSKIRWRFGTIDSQTQPPIVLEGLPVCGNCHSFSADATAMGMDVDYANDKGSYAIAPVAKEMVLERDKIITWSKYGSEDKEDTFGLLSQISPNGRYVVSTVKDLSVFVATPGLSFSQLFFPIKGILVFYDRESRTFHALPGADDKAFVQSNPTWSPDGKTLIFARSRVHHLKTLGPTKTVLLTEEQCREFLEEGKIFQYDLYRIPFNDGQGGQAEPLEGASGNGMSNYFARYSPDGKWVVFCRARSFMLLQPDAELYILPATGGKARRLRCNTPRMNSWHSWSPNGKWLVFSSKANGPYTQLFLTHIDEEGRSTPPVLLDRLTAPDRAANIPEFVNAEPGAIARIREQFLDAVSFRRAAREFVKAGDLENAIRQCRKSLELNPNNPKVRYGYALLLFRKGDLEAARAHFAKTAALDPGNRDALRALRAIQAEQACRRTLKLDPQDTMAQYHLGKLLVQRGRTDQAVGHFGEAARLEPALIPSIRALANGWLQRGRPDRAALIYRCLLERKPDDVGSLTHLALILASCRDDGLRDGAEAVALASKACALTHGGDPAILSVQAAAYAEAGRFPEAIRAAAKAVEIATEGGNDRLAHSIQESLELYRQSKPLRAP